MLLAVSHPASQMRHCSVVFSSSEQMLASLKKKQQHWDTGGPTHMQDGPIHMQALHQKNFEKLCLKGSGDKKANTWQAPMQAAAMRRTFSSLHDTGNIRRDASHALFTRSVVVQEVTSKLWNYFSSHFSSHLFNHFSHSVGSRGNSLIVENDLFLPAFGFPPRAKRRNIFSVIAQDKQHWLCLHGKCWN